MFRFLFISNTRDKNWWLRQINHTFSASQGASSCAVPCLFGTLVLWCSTCIIWIKEWWDRWRWWFPGPLESQAVMWANRTCACCSGLQLDLSVPRLSAVEPAPTGCKAMAKCWPEWVLVSFELIPRHTHTHTSTVTLARTGGRTSEHAGQVKRPASQLQLVFVGISSLYPQNIVWMHFFSEQRIKFSSSLNQYRTMQVNCC